MEEKPHLSEAETEILAVVWRLGSATGQEVFEAYSNDRGVEYETVRTFLRRLVTKKYLRTTKRGRSTVYTPRVAQKSVVRSKLQDLMRHLFHGQAAPLVEHLLDKGDISDQELEHLRDVIDERLSKDP